MEANCMGLVLARVLGMASPNSISKGAATAMLTHLPSSPKRMINKPVRSVDNRMFAISLLTMIVMRSRRGNSSNFWTKDRKGYLSSRIL
jgi:hypothetical protein